MGLHDALGNCGGTPGGRSAIPEPIQSLVIQDLDRDHGNESVGDICGTSGALRIWQRERGRLGATGGTDRRHRHAWCLWQSFSRIDGAYSAC